MKLDGAQRSLLLAVAMVAGAVWAYRLHGIGFLSDDFVQLLDWATDAAPPVTTWFSREYCGYYRPLSALAWRLEYLLWGMDAGGYRLVNLALHGGCASCLFYVARQGGLRPRVALVAALFFACNPGHIIGVLSVSGVAGTLCAVLYMASLAAHLRAGEGGRAWYAVSLTAFAAALLAKETAASLPVLILALHLLVRRNGLRQALYSVGPYFAVLAGYLGLRYWLFGHLPQVALAHKSTDPWTIVTNMVLYGGTTVSPWGLDWLKPAFRGNCGLLAVAGVVALAAGLGSAVLLRRRLQRAHLFWAVWFGLTLAPVVRLYSPWNSYLPAAGAGILLATWLYHPGLGWWPRIGRCMAHLWLAAAVAFQFVYQTEWIRASDLCERVVAAAARVAAEERGPWYLAGVPAEYRGVPVFGGPWGIEGALRLKAKEGVLPTVLPTVHYGRLEAGTAAQVDSSGHITLRLENESDFFRLNEVSVLSRESIPAVGFVFSAGPYAARVAGISSQRQPSVLEIVPAGIGGLPRVLTWDGTRLVAASQPAL